MSYNFRIKKFVIARYLCFKREKKLYIEPHHISLPRAPKCVNATLVVVGRGLKFTVDVVVDVATFLQQYHNNVGLSYES